MRIEDYDLILGVDWLSGHGARVDCKNKTVQFVKSGWDALEFQDNWTKELKFQIVGNKAAKMLANRCQGYLAYLLNKQKDKCVSHP
jgi:hypothetical protein